MIVENWGKEGLLKFYVKFGSWFLGGVKLKGIICWVGFVIRGGIGNVIGGYEEYKKECSDYGYSLVVFCV